MFLISVFNLQSPLSCLSTVYSQIKGSSATKRSVCVCVTLWLFYLWGQASFSLRWVKLNRHWSAGKGPVLLRCSLVVSDCFSSDPAVPLILGRRRFSKVAPALQGSAGHGWYSFSLFSFWIEGCLVIQSYRCDWSKPL